MPEILHTSPETINQTDIDQSIRTAASYVAELAFEPDFQAYLSAHNVRLDNEDPDIYWGAVANFINENLESNSSGSSLERDSLALVGGLPLMLTKQYELNQHDKTSSWPGKRAAKEATCAYNGQLRHFVGAYPQQSADLHNGLLMAALETVGSESDDYLRHANTTIEAILKGVKHEIGFTRLLEATGIPFRETTTAEDLKGKDVVILYPGKEIGVDIKASTSDKAFQQRVSDTDAYVVKPDGDIVIYSMMHETAFRGGFEPDESYLSSISETAGNVIREAIVKSLAK